MKHTITESGAHSLEIATTHEGVTFYSRCEYIEDLSKVFTDHTNDIANFNRPDGDREMVVLVGPEKFANRDRMIVSRNGVTMEISNKIRGVA